ncbi:MAG: hypothetical protein JWO35_854 [Candidatus Saccharibacteria bacterium]|nr:hypothetical protein [Candidatus Saccharibacteria bacterium]
MLGKAKSWHAGLSKAGKILLWSATAAFGVVGISAASPGGPPETVAPTVQSTKAETKKPVVEVKTETQVADVAFDKTTKQDGNLEKGKTQLVTAGVVGVKTSTYNVTYTDGVETSRALVKEEVTTAPTSEVTAIGTYVAPAPRASNCDPNYTPCVPNVSYDLDCPDIGFSVRVIGSDPHRFDGDHDGYGCESY